MPKQRLTSTQILKLVSRVFPPLSQDHSLAILVDLPAKEEDDSAAWQARRRFAVTLYQTLAGAAARLGLEEVLLIAYEAVGANNGDLPPVCYALDGPLPATAPGLQGALGRIETEALFGRCQIFIAPTEFSATAPLKIAARHHAFRAATMPGFSEAMIPALQIDYEEVAQRLENLKGKLDPADSASILFRVRETEHYFFDIDLRHRTAHLSTGRFPGAGMVGNLPSGETYIVPYEGEQEPESCTRGELPVQFGDEIVLYHVERNRARSAFGNGPAAQTESTRLQNEPAYGNIAELGFGILADFGIEPVGEILLDEKLGLHIAFGRSDHFGGFVGAGQFSSPQALVHIDRIYIPQCQPLIEVASLKLNYPDGRSEEIMRGGRYLDFAPSRA
ncbi:MAG TPA: hypothetical protein PLN61_07920 [bacterium]|nr:hypothetical protein [bacterium]HQI48580.1 hypothetical protein [bacterium]HQJ64036.1 hypothetical protein [bacterium]